NNCMLTINTFEGDRTHITGNRCERGLGSTCERKSSPNMFTYKLKRVFSYKSLSEKEATRGIIGIPRVLNMYENYPYWATFFKELGFRVVLSPLSSRKLYELGMDSIPSESECYPAKLAHGHVQWLINKGIETIFHPCVFYEHQECSSAKNHFNCPMVVSYAENLKNNVEDVVAGKVKYIRPFMAFTNEKSAADRLVRVCFENWGIPEKEVRKAAQLAWLEQNKARADIKAEGKKVLREMEKSGGKGIVLAGRPYHLDPEVNHGIPELIASFGLTVFTEDSLPPLKDGDRKLRVVDQWVYHSRLYTAAEFVSQRNDMELIQLTSFGCGLDAVTADQVNEILEGSNKLYTLLKIDEVSNLGAARIRVRSLISAMKMRDKQGILAKPQPVRYKRAEFTEKMRREKYTIIAPQMSPIHFDILEPVFSKHGYNVEILQNDNRTAINTGLQYVNNDACYPSITVVGQIMEAVLSGKYNTDKLAIFMSQTGGCCRASNYVGFIRRALDKAGLSHIPVISINANGMEKNSGFSWTVPLLKDAIYSLIYGDLFMRCLYHVRPYELVPGSADKLHAELREMCIDSLTNPKTKYKYKQLCRKIVKAFDELPIDESVKKPRVGIVGEILVKYMPLANNHAVELLEREGAEAVVPDILDFFNYTLYGGRYKQRFLGAKWYMKPISHLGVKLVRWVRKPAIKALEESSRFEAPVPIEEIAKMTKPFLSIGNQYGEGWFLTGEMVELINSGTPNIICVQPFACLPNHVVGKGVIKTLKNAFPESNICAVDYDPGASEVNQLNRIKLMLSTAKKNMENSETKEAKGKL
ncbi:MAG: acyl-CoA dehydratase activase-related protein, partial [Oscillospiraceae bacterium]|nr:acyl-CoA dehydratase activase-related protein [Oscillospiraceae bacterium]